MADARVVAALGALPPHELRTLAAGVSVHAVNPPKVTQTLPGVALGAGAAQASELARQQISFREVQAQGALALRNEQEARTIALDRGNYLAQFYPDFDSLEHLGLRAWLQFRVASMLRTVLPASLWFQLRARFKGQRAQHAERLAGEGKNRKPFLTVVIDPCDPSALINAFFSLVHQTFTDWELLLVERPGQLPGTRRALRDFARLDERVRVLRMRGEPRTILTKARSEARGDFVINLPEGATLAFRAVESMVTLVRQRPQTSAIVADFEHASADHLLPIRCHVSAQSLGLPDETGFFAHRSKGGGDEKQETFNENVAHIPDVLYRHTGKWHPFCKKGKQ